MELLGETPNGLSANATLAKGDKECQYYFASADSSSKDSSAFHRQQVSARPLQDQTHCELVYRPLQFHERRQYFIGMYDETLSVTMRVNNPDRSPPMIQS